MRFIEISKPLITRLLTESALVEAEGKNTHLEHLEDNIFNRGYKGAKELPCRSLKPARPLR